MRDVLTKVTAGVILVLLTGTSGALLAHGSRLTGIEASRKSEAEARKGAKAAEVKAHDEKHDAVKETLGEIKDAQAEMRADLKKILEMR